MQWAAILFIVGAVLFATGRPSHASESAERVSLAMRAMLNTEHGDTSNVGYFNDLASAMLDDANARGVDVGHYVATAWTESRFEPCLTSSSGAVGLYQQKPQYAHPESTAEQLCDPVYATWVFGNKIDRMRERYGHVLSDEHWAHYADGNVITDGWEYAAYHERIRTWFHDVLAELDT